MGKQSPIGSRHDLDQILLDLYRIALPGQAQQVRYTSHVRIDDNALFLPEGVSQHDICRLSSHPGKRCQRFHSVRHDTVVIGQQGLTARFDGFRLVSVESGRPNHLLDAEALVPKKKGDEDKMGAAMHRIMPSAKSKRLPP